MARESEFASRYNKGIAAPKMGVRSSATQADASVPTITSGEGAPTSTEPNGSQYMRTIAATAADVIYMRVGGAWLALDGR